MVDELEPWSILGWPDPEVRVHIWLGLLDGEPALECIMHVNLRRQVMLTHHLAATPPLPPSVRGRRVDRREGAD